MAGNTFDINTDLHTATLSSVDTAIRRFCGNNEFRTDLIFINDILPAETVTVFFLNSSDNHDLVSFRNQIHVFHDFCTVYSRYETTALVGHATAADFFVCFVSFVWIKIPVFDVADTNGINVCIECKDFVTITHITDNITLRINGNFVEVQLFHFCFDGFDVLSLIAAFARVFYDGS